MNDRELETRRESLINQVTQAYANNGLEMEKFELIVTQLQSADTAGDLEQIATTLPLWRDIQFREINANYGNIRMEGPWLGAPAWHIAGKGSNIRLDLRDYDNVEGLRIVFDLDLKGSNCKIILPFGWSLETHFDTIEASNTKNRPPRDYPLGSNQIIVTGSLVNSNFKVRYRG